MHLFMIYILIYFPNVGFYFKQQIFEVASHFICE